MNRDTIQFSLIVLGQLIGVLIAIWKIGRWTESVNASIKILVKHVSEDEIKFKDLYEKYNDLLLEFTKNEK